MAEYMPAHATTPPRLEISTKIIDANGDDFIYSNMVAFINEYDGAKLVSELSVKLLTPDLPLYKTLQDRGRNFVGLNGVHYMSLDGVLIINRGRDIIRVRVIFFLLTAKTSQKLELWSIAKPSAKPIQVTIIPLVELVSLISFPLRALINITILVTPSIPLSQHRVIHQARFQEP